MMLTATHIGQLRRFGLRPHRRQGRAASSLRSGAGLLTAGPQHIARPLARPEPDMKGSSEPEKIALIAEEGSRHRLPQAEPGSTCQHQQHETGERNQERRQLKPPSSKPALRSQQGRRRAPEPSHFKRVTPTGKVKQKAGQEHQGQPEKAARDGDLVDEKRPQNQWPAIPART